MTTQIKIAILGLAVVASLMLATGASAQCSTCATPTYSAYYAPTTAYYAPATTSYYGGWYPGKYLGNFNRWLWGAPATTVYGSTYAAYPSTSAYYAPASTCNTCGTSPCTTSCCPTGCSTGCSTGCNTCTTFRQVTLRPVTTAYYAPSCSTCSAYPSSSCSSCSTGYSSCSSCSVPSVSQSVYTTPSYSSSSSSSCSTCQANVAPQQQGSTSNGQSPTLEPNEDVSPERTYLKPTDEADPYDNDTTEGSSTTFEAPQLLRPNGRTAQTITTPVWTAVYHQAAGTSQTSAAPVSYQQAQQDAAGWESAGR